MKSIDLRYQQHLRELNLYNGPVDGIQGPNTTRAIKQFQTMNGVTPDGIVGKKTVEIFESQLQHNPNNAKEAGMFSRYKFSNKPYTAWPKESTSSLMSFYGNVGTNQTTIPAPYKMYLAWDLKKSVSRITCHEKVADSLSIILENISKSYSPADIEKHGFNLFGGTLNVRKIRGGNRYSTHSWGIAIDLDPARNQLKWKRDRAYFARPECAYFLEIFKEQGCYSLGAERDYDYMHFQFCYR